MNNLKKFFLFFYLFFVPSIFADGFIAGTLVKTPDGPVAIERLKKGDSVLACGFDGYYYPEPVFFVGKKEASFLIKLIIADEVILTAPDQYFLKEPESAWVPAADLQQGDKVHACRGHLTVESVEIFNEPVEIYIITVEERGNFYISSREIVAHNIVPAVALAASALAKGVGFVVLEHVGEAAVYGGCALGIAYLGKQALNQQRARRQSSSRTTTAVAAGGGNGRPPDDPEWWKKRGSNRNKEWKKNKVSKQEFFNDPLIKASYRSTRDGSWILRGDGTALEGADRLDWDYTHGDVEAYRKGKHLGSVDPETKRLYKPPVQHRTFKK